VKKFIFRGFIFIGIGIALLFILNVLYVRTYGYACLSDTSRFFVASNNLDVVNLGSSYGRCDFDYSAIDGIHGANLAVYSQNFYYDFEILKKYGNHLPQGCVVIILVTDISFVRYCGDSSNQRLKYYELLNYGSIPNHNPIEDLEYGWFPILTAKSNVKYMFDDRSPEKNPDAPNVMDESMRMSLAQKAVETSVDFHKDPQAEENRQMNIDKLDQMIEYCQARNYRPVLVTSPFTKYYNEFLPQEYYTDMYATINDVCKKYGTPYLDYSHDPRFTEKPEYFQDSTHMDLLGARAFTPVVLSDLGII
jgi:hypothetical protein